MWQILQVIQMVWSMIGQIKQWMSAKRKADAEEMAQKHEEALDKGKSAKTAKEAFDDETQVVNSEP
jgi:hypothetical protein